MKRLVVLLFACAACTSPPAQRTQNSAPPVEVTRPPLVVTAPVTDCSVDGAACEAFGTLCPVPGVCREGACVPSRVGELPRYPQRVTVAGGPSGPMLDDGSIFVIRAWDPPGLFSPSGRTETENVEVRLVSGRIGLGSRGGATFSALDLDTDTVLWTILLGPGDAAWGARGTDNGEGIVAVAHEPGSRSVARGTLWFVRIADGSIVRSHDYAGSARGLSSDASGRVFLRTAGADCRLRAFDAEGAPLWNTETECALSRELVVHRDRIFDGAHVRDPATGKVTATLTPGLDVRLASDDVLVAASYDGVLELRDPDTLERRFRQAGGGTPFALTTRATVLTAARASIYLGDACASDCTDPTGDIREYTFDGRLVGLCDAAPHGALLSNGLLWVGYESHAIDGYDAHPAPGYLLADEGWVTAAGTPGAQYRAQ